MILIPTHLEKAIRAHCEADYPHECCGLLLGVLDGDGQKILRETYPISNAREEAAKRNRFLITPQELLGGEKYARAQKLDVLGFYHSHPDHPARPSGFDLDHAWPFYSYIIVAVHQGRAGDFTSWELLEDRSGFSGETLESAPASQGV